MAGNIRPLNNVRPEGNDSIASNQPSPLPIFQSDPSRSELPADSNADPVPIAYMSDGSTGVTGDSGDVAVAAPDGSGGVDTTVASNISASITLGEDSTGLL